MKQLVLLCGANGPTAQNFITDSPNRHATKRTLVSTFSYGATAQGERSQQQVQRRAHHLCEIASAGNLLAQIGQCSERVNEFLGRRLHLRISAQSGSSQNGRG